MLYYHSVLGYFQLNWISTAQKVALVSLASTVVESLPTTEVVDDNISVLLASMAAAFLSFHVINNLLKKQLVFNNLYFIPY
jgi:phytol kinase